MTQTLYLQNPQRGLPSFKRQVNLGLNFRSRKAGDGRTREDD